MSTKRTYKDANGNNCPLLHLIKQEPEWAENQILHRDKLETELAEVTKERDALKHALIELEAAAEAYAADQSRASDSRCGLVQPITVEDGNRLLSALKIANEFTK